MLRLEFKKASQIFFIVCKLYNRWKINIKVSAAENNTEFGMDDYIRTKSRYAESIMQMGDFHSAIDKFENAKLSIENEIVYEHPLLFVNICNLLGNCYIKVGNLGRALQNFE